MKKIVIVAALLIGAQLFCRSDAQVPKVPTGKVNAGSLVTQFANAIKPSSFLSNWTSGKSGWLASAGKIASAGQMANSISSLAGFIKPGMFKSGFNLQTLQQAASAAKTMGEATGLLKNLEKGLKPEAMSSDWGSKKTSWESALQMLN